MTNNNTTTASDNILGTTAAPVNAGAPCKAGDQVTATVLNFRDKDGRREYANLALACGGSTRLYANAMPGQNKDAQQAALDALKVRDQLTVHIISVERFVPKAPAQMSRQLTRQMWTFRISRRIAFYRDIQSALSSRPKDTIATVAGESTNKTGDFTGWNVTIPVNDQQVEAYLPPSQKNLEGYKGPFHSRMDAARKDLQSGNRLEVEITTVQVEEEMGGRLRLVVSEMAPINRVRQEKYTEGSQHGGLITRELPERDDMPGAFEVSFGDAVGILSKSDLAGATGCAVGQRVNVYVKSVDTLRGFQMKLAKQPKARKAAPVRVHHTPPGKSGGKKDKGGKKGK